MTSTQQLQSLLKFQGVNMVLKFLLLGIFVIGVSAREIELESFKPSKDANQDLIDYGTVRITKVKKNYYTISGDFTLKRNIANEQKVKKN